MATNFTQLTNSELVVAQLQAKYGTMQQGNLQTLRKQYYSSVAYPDAGSSVLNFFGNALGNNGTNAQTTNMPVAGSFGTSSFLVKAVGCTYFLAEGYAPASYDGTDATAFASDMLAGWAQAGYFNLSVNAKTFIEFPKPFMSAPPLNGRASIFSGGQTVASFFNNYPWAELMSRGQSKYLVDPEILIKDQQNFGASIQFPTGSLAPIFTAGTLYVTVVLDGIEFRPVQ